MFTMKFFSLASSGSLLFSSILAFQHKMVKLHPRVSTQNLTLSDSASSRNASALNPSSQTNPPEPQDSDADDALEHDEMMRAMMRTKAESVISTLFDADVDAIVNGGVLALHPGALSNVTWELDLFEAGNILPTSSSKADPQEGRAGRTIHSFMSTSGGEGAGDSRDLNHDGVVSVDELLTSFFHADNVKTVFDAIKAKTNADLRKDDKKAIIKQKAPALHKTIEKVASHRGWGFQDARFAQLHEERIDGGETFRDYNTFVKTMRSALITPHDAAQDSADEQETAPRTDPATKA